MGFPRQEYGNGLPFLFPSDLPDPGIEPVPPALAGGFFLNHWAIRKTCKSTMCPAMLSCFSRVWLCATLWTVAHQAPQSMGFSRQEYWSGLTCPSPGNLSNPGIASVSLKSLALAGGFFTTSATWEAHKNQLYSSKKKKKKSDRVWLGQLEVVILLV